MHISLFSNSALAGITAGRTITAAGTMTYAPQGTSFSAPVSYPITNLTLSCKGLTIGKVGNGANVTVGSNTAIDGPINIYGGALALNAVLSTTSLTTGDILLQGATLSGTGNEYPSFSWYISSNDFILRVQLIFNIHYLIFLPLFVHKQANKILKVLIFLFYNVVFIQQIYFISSRFKYCRNQKKR
jgi:hypothetical protein